ncbi:uncharacterized protein MELLADRAFT_68288 [Melampsora larici-populina 98AG31]|uniref:Secreted protein n=1 Tax=Melampsora larici-populina (strain 98AG31 / pathotype 3-4-7) TaxID=747676 RepID=F4S689_MELLP|nr:uncharacterized protein MELLADRAFT_68288 [Melampsora larici-populina 98AG31]EGF99772.1 hypothetical protein MELLADRAFT_68288 [Melampsora larici-populina 98AG31]
MRCSSLFAMVACLGLTTIYQPVASMKLEQGSNLAVSTKYDEVPEASAADMAAWKNVQVYSLLKTYQASIQQSTDKIKKLMHMKPKTQSQGGFEFDYCLSIFHEIELMIRISHTSSHGVEQVESNPMPAKMPLKIPTADDIADVTHNTANLLSNFWQEAADTTLPCFAKYDAPKLPDLASAFCDIIKKIIQHIHDTIACFFKHFFPDFDHYKDLGMGFDQILNLLKGLIIPGQIESA